MTREQNTTAEELKEFLSESYEGLEGMADELLRLEQNPRDVALVGSLFRAVHTIKGTCGFLGLNRLEAIAHVAENVLSALRDGQLCVDANVISALMMTNDVCLRMLSSIESTGTEGDVDASKAEALLLAQLRALAVEKQTRESGAPTEILPNERKPVARRSIKVNGIDVVPDSGPEQPSLGNILVRNGVPEPEIVAALAAQRSGDPRKLGEILIDKQACGPAEIREALIEQGEIHLTTALDNVRVDTALLDKLMNQVGELVLIRNQINQFTSRFADRAFASAAQRLNLITTELQEGVVKTRMQPIGTLWNKFPRLIRHLCLVLDRQVELEMVGNDTELDRTIIEAIRDPLTHLIRNAIDHGIEPTTERVAAGKAAAGTLRLRAFHEGGQVNIEISDDGKGINTDALREKAVSAGLVGAVESARLCERDALGLVFRPGLSTAKEVTNISGRGVGMDVVKTNIERIGGTIDLQSVRGKGTTIRIKIPLTLAIIPALLVATRSECYAVPQVSLVEVVRLDGQSARGSIEYVAGAPVYRLRGSLLPVVYLAEVLDDEPAPATEEVNIVVVSADQRVFGLVVDQIHDTAEIVVKALSPQLKGLRIFTGATILGDGSVALILDVLGLAQRARVLGERREATADKSPSSEVVPVQNERLLLVGVGHDRQLALPLAVVARLEELNTSAVEYAGGRRVLQYRDTLLPLVWLSTALGLPCTMQETMQVVVYSHQGKHLGLVVDRIVDIVESRHSGPEVPSIGPAIRGSTVIQKRVTDLLDLDQLEPARQALGMVGA